MKAFLNRGQFSEKEIRVNIGGSKSESNRLLVLQAQYPELQIHNLSKSDDTAVLQNGLKTNAGVLDIHHAGTAMRFLTAYFATKAGAEVTITGSPRMQERPIAVLVEALKSLGADIQYLKKQGFPPVKIKGKMLHEKFVKIKADVSSQYISALMLVAPKFPEGLKISLTGETASAPYIKMTLSLLKNIGIAGSFKNSKIEIPATKDIIKTTLTVESDWSSASYFYSLVALSENGKITLEKFYAESLQGDSILPQIYDSLGVKTVFNSSEKTISLSKIECQLPDSLLLALANTPDLAQTLAVTCFGLGLGCKLTGLKTLKIKETDRLLALKNELEKLGATVQIDDDSLRLEPAAHIFPNQTVETYQDHRMAMAFAPLALKTQITINDADVVSKSYPGFWNDLMKTGIECAFKDS